MQPSPADITASFFADRPGDHQVVPRQLGPINRRHNDPEAFRRLVHEFREMQRRQASRNGVLQTPAE